MEVLDHNESCNRALRKQANESVSLTFSILSFYLSIINLASSTSPSHSVESIRNPHFSV